jgi:hypothetical protein
MCFDASNTIPMKPAGKKIIFWFFHVQIIAQGFYVFLFIFSHLLNSVDPDPLGSACPACRIDLDRLDPDPGGKIYPQEKKKSEKLYCFDVLDVLLIEGRKLLLFSCSSEVHNI